MLKNDFNRLDNKYQDTIKNSHSFEGRGDKQQIKVLEEEIAYIKKHFEMEVGLMKDENDILKKELMDV